MTAARSSDPIGSHLTVASILADTSLAGLILWAVKANEGPSTDDDVLKLMEARTKRRYQRNVIARARGRLELEGDLVRLPSLVSPITHRPVVTYELSRPVQLALIED